MSRALTPKASAAVVAAARDRGPAAVELCRELVRIPSPSGAERDAALHVADRMRELGLDDVSIDRAGNAIGLVRSGHGGPAIMLNAHLDHVDAGDVSSWPHPPFEGVLSGGRLWGRGSTDTKSAVAAQVQAAAVLRELVHHGQLELRRDVLVAAVVQEEVGGLGTACLIEDRPPPAVAVIGEPSLGGLCFGHRGRVEIEVRFTGRAAHASRPEWGVNPHRTLARFVGRLDELALDGDPLLGRSSVAPTLVSASPSSPNVIPEQVTLILDWRNVPGESPDVIRERVRELAQSSVDEGVSVDVRTPTVHLRSWAGVDKPIERVSRGFRTPSDGTLFRGALQLLEEAMGRTVPVLAWDFASDGGWLHAAGVPCIGHGPGEMELMHAARESVSTDLLCEAVASYALLAAGLGHLVESPVQSPP